MNITELIDALNSKIQAIKWENEALNSKIRTLKAENEALKKELAELKQKQLFKEDFGVLTEMYYVNGSMQRWGNDYDYCLKDNSKYYKLPSKDVK
ncbi:hypothetical protein [Spiroplasma phoeniceum]|uniref:Uncharacterized protein n=1 Tax=Spiroplasma phoeniceum P40 TaxID=1276259 RepID=A0A345DQT9_9MOLU|nr:hypothetical protein [Spiroplasma phoeniceum]AXF96580.1 hypothetical protein SDAV_001620 [Spiroplasma phoeniceum P40]